MRGLIYGGSDYAKFANYEILKFAMIETREALDNLDEIMSVEGIDGIYIGPADLSLSVGEQPGFDKPENSKAYEQIIRILEYSKKHGIFSAIHNGTSEYALKMIKEGFNLVTVGADQLFIKSEGAKLINKLEGEPKNNNKSNNY